MLTGTHFDLGVLEHFVLKNHTRETHDICKDF